MRAINSTPANRQFGLLLTCNPQCHLRPCLHAELCEHMLKMSADGALGNGQPQRDLTVGETERKKTRYIPLARAERSAHS